MASFAQDVIMRGDTAKLYCPSSSGCKTYLTEFHLKEVNISQELIDKFTLYSLNNAIDAMDDFSWCPIPECAAPAELDKVKNYGRCT
jgi:hypothetical protein